MQELAERSGLTADLVRHWFSVRAKAAVTHTTATEAVVPGVAADLPLTGPCPLEPLPGGRLEKKTVQSDCSVATPTKEPTPDQTVSAAKGNLYVRSFTFHQMCTGKFNSRIVQGNPFSPRGAPNNLSAVCTAP